MACVFVLLSTSSPAPTCHLRSPRRCGPLISPGGHQLSVLTPSAHPPPNLLYVSRTRAADAAADAAAVRAGATAVSTIRSNATALVCVPAKAGSTSFYFWLFHALSGAPWPYSGPPWIQDVSSARWANLSGVRVSRFDKMALRQRIRALSDPLIKRAYHHSDTQTNPYSFQPHECPLPPRTPTDGRSRSHTTPSLALMLRSAAIGFALTRDPLERAVSAYYSKMACDTGDAADQYVACAHPA